MGRGAITAASGCGWMGWSGCAQRRRGEAWWLATSLENRVSKVVSYYNQRMAIKERFQYTKGHHLGRKLRWTPFTRAEFVERTPAPAGVRSLIPTVEGKSSSTLLSSSALLVVTCRPSIMKRARLPWQVAAYLVSRPSSVNPKGCFASEGSQTELFVEGRLQPKCN